MKIHKIAVQYKHKTDADEKYSEDHRTKMKKGENI